MGNEPGKRRRKRSAAGSVSKHRDVWTARLRYTDPVTGARKEIRKVAPNRGAAVDLLAEIRRQVASPTKSPVLPSMMTFADIAKHYLEHYVVEPSYVDGRKVAGLRSWRSVTAYVKTLKRKLGAKLLESITFGDLRTLRLELLAEEQGRRPTSDADAEASADEQPKKAKRTIANANRILAALRRMLSIAEREGWIRKNPFNLGEPLITPADEKSRTRILSHDEEKRLLAACRESPNEVLEALVLAALETGCRRGELLKLHTADVDLKAKVITIRETHTKTQKGRVVPITPRLAKMLRPLVLARQPEDTLFGIRNNVKTSFNNARSKAGVPDLRFHDLRHTAATRLVRGGIQLAEVGRILGHSDVATTYRYANADSETLNRVRDALTKSAERQ
ncbi:MAG: site-specific integrase [Thermoanaerobaculia bacterium]|nr:site-specific integrase [Thermoanaerobaculia bacterium]